MFKFIGNMLKSAGRAIANAAKGVAKFFARTVEQVQKNLLKGIKWVWNTKPVQWLWKSEPVQWLAKFMGPAFNWVWSVVSGPIGWVSATILAVFGVTILPVVIAAVLAAVILGIVIWIVWANSGKPKDVMQPIHDAIVDMGEKDFPVDKDETPGQRFGILELEMEKAQIADDNSWISGLYARINLLIVRSGGHPKLAKNTRVNAINANTKHKAMADDPSRKWDWDAMLYGTLSEDKRLRHVEALNEEYKAEQSRKADAERKRRTAKKAAKPVPQKGDNLTSA